MNRAVRLLILLLAVAVGAQAVWLCLATGGRAFTRFRSAEIETVNAERGLESLFDSAGLNESHGTLGSVESAFAFGWLPAGTGQDAISVLTVAGPALAIGVLALWPARRAPRRSTPAQPS